MLFCKIEQTLPEGSRRASALHGSSRARQERTRRHQVPVRVSNRVFKAIVVLELAEASFAQHCAPPLDGCGNLVGVAQRGSIYSRCLWLMLRTRARRFARAADALCPWSLRRRLLCEACTSCGLFGSRITLALGSQRGFILHLGALDGPVKWLCL